MPTVKGRIGDNIVDVLRDTSFSGIVVNKKLASEGQLTGDFNCI